MKKMMTKEEVLYKLAAYCSSAERCVQDVEKKLQKADLSQEDNQQILHRLQQEKFVDDRRYAFAFVNDKIRFNQWGRIKIAYELKNIATGEIVSAEPAYSISHDGKSEILTFPESLPFGIYEFSVWGNLEPGTKSDGLSDTIVLHQDAKGEAKEVYHYTAVLNYDYDKASYTAGLKRAVGCLLVDATNLPSRINFSKKEISGVMSKVSKGLE